MLRLRTTLIYLALVGYAAYKGLEYLTTPTLMPPDNVITKLVEQSHYKNGFKFVSVSDRVVTTTPRRELMEYLFQATRYTSRVDSVFETVDDLYRRKVVSGQDEAHSTYVLRVPKGRRVKIEQVVDCQVLTRRGISLTTKPVYRTCQIDKKRTHAWRMEDFYFEKELTRDEEISGGLYLGQEIRARFPNANTTIGLLTDAEIRQVTE